MKQGNFLNIFRPKSIIYFVFLIIFSVITLMYNPTIGMVEIGIILILFVLDKFINFNRNAKLNEYLNDLSMSSDSITREFALNSVLPLAILKNKSEVIWYNDGFEKMFFNEENKDKSSIREIIRDFPKLTDDDTLDIIIPFNDKFYNVLGTTLCDSRSQGKSYSMIYFLDITEQERLKTELNEKSIVFAKIIIDNYDEVIGILPEGERAVLIAETDKHIYGWATGAGAYITKLEKDKFLLVFEKKQLDKYLSDGFEKLRDLRGCTKEGCQPLTLSIGVGADAENPVKANEASAASIDMALGRGGDQVVLKTPEGFMFHGGNSKEVEKRTKVRSRVVAHALRGLIESKDNVVVMGHKNPDMDFMGSALGVYRAAKTFGKNCYIIIEEISPAVSEICNLMQNSDEYKNIIIGKAQAEVLLEENGMLIITDTHSSALMPYPELLQNTESVVLIDHHRKSADFYGNTALAYHETYASSASELVAEILQYISEDIKLTSVESMALYAGILLDTRNFTFKTGVRTFEAASYLRRCGLNTAEAKELLKSGLENYVLKNSIISSAEIYNNNIAISSYIKDEIPDKSIAAQSADELLNIKGISTAFVIYRIDGLYGISARSIGDINVQIIMEKLGGGGHQLAAGVQFESGNANDVYEKLKKEIDEYLKKG